MTFKRTNLVRDNKFLFNGKDLSNLAIVETIKRQVLPSITNTSVSLPSRNGRKFQNSILAQRTITVTLRLIENTYEDVQKQVLNLASHLYSEKPSKLELRDSTIYNYAIVSQISDVEKLLNTGSCEVVFECNDSYNYGVEKEIKLGPITKFVNSGTAPARGIFELRSKAQDSIKVIINNGDYLELKNSFIENANIVIDLDKEFITINGTSLMNKLTLESNFFEIPPGNNEIKIVGATGKLKMIERWL